MTPPFITESEGELKSLLMKVKEESNKVGLKFNIQKLTSWYPVPPLRDNRWRNSGNVTDFIVLCSNITADGDCSHEIKNICSWEKNYDKPRQPIKRQSHYFTNKGPYSQSYGFSSSHVWKWELDHKESWVQKNRCFWTVVLEKTFESPLDFKEIKPVNRKGNQPWILIGRTDAEAPVLWPPDGKNRLIRKDPDAEEDWMQEKKGMTKDEMVRWHPWLSGPEFEQAAGNGKGQGSLECSVPWDHKLSDTVKWVNNYLSLISILSFWECSRHLFFFFFFSPWYSGEKRLICLLTS